MVEDDRFKGEYIVTDFRSDSFDKMTIETDNLLQFCRLNDFG